MILVKILEAYLVAEVLAPLVAAIGINWHQNYDDGVLFVGYTGIVALWFVIIFGVSLLMMFGKL